MRLLRQNGSLSDLCVITANATVLYGDNSRGDDASLSTPSTTLLAGFLAVLIGYASSAAIIWQERLSSLEPPLHKSSVDDALGWQWASVRWLDITGSRTVLTAWSTPGAALLVTGLQGCTLNEAIGVFIVTNALIACGYAVSAGLMRHYSALACGGNACRDFITLWFTGVCQSDGQFTLCGSMLLVWLEPRPLRRAMR
ncbi:benzoate/H(+) symporter BenE family transporter [Escherichia coli]